MYQYHCCIGYNSNWYFDIEIYLSCGKSLIMKNKSTLYTIIVWTFRLVVLTVILGLASLLVSSCTNEAEPNPKVDSPIYQIDTPTQHEKFLKDYYNGKT